jgi:hypothetical protein
MITQLQHYGLPVPEGTKAVLMAAMRKALAEGKVHSYITTYLLITHKSRLTNDVVYRSTGMDP